mmetsp:Transcript_23554/g.79518  ORF Transcript_23554/g.79518 Transcript_23554/m.79518 type:complete len:253 (-) Transcript_23554:996-1754(-)
MFFERSKRYYQSRGRHKRRRNFRHHPRRRLRRRLWPGQGGEVRRGEARRFSRRRLDLASFRPATPRPRRPRPSGAGRAPLPVRRAFEAAVRAGGAPSRFGTTRPTHQGPPGRLVGGGHCRCGLRGAAGAAGTGCGDRRGGNVDRHRRARGNRRRQCEKGVADAARCFVGKAARGRALGQAGCFGGLFWARRIRRRTYGRRRFGEPVAVHGPRLEPRRGGRVQARVHRPTRRGFRLWLRGVGFDRDSQRLPGL